MAAKNISKQYDRSTDIIQFEKKRKTKLNWKSMIFTDYYNPTTTENTLLNSTHEIFKTDHVPVQNNNLQTFQKAEILQCVLSTKLEINYKSVIIMYLESSQIYGN